jgi:hypothetical protein
MTKRRKTVDKLTDKDVLIESLLLERDELYQELKVTPDCTLSGNYKRKGSVNPKPDGKGYQRKRPGKWKFIP